MLRKRISHLADWCSWRLKHHQSGTKGAFGLCNIHRAVSSEVRGCLQPAARPKSHTLCNLHLNGTKNVHRANHPLQPTVRLDFLCLNSVNRQQAGRTLLDMVHSSVHSVFKPVCSPCSLQFPVTLCAFQFHLVYLLDLWIVGASFRTEGLYCREHNI